MNAPAPQPGNVRLVQFQTLFGGTKVEGAESAYQTAIDTANEALQAAAHGGAGYLVEPMHDALSRLAALSAAGLLGVVK